MSTSRIVRPEEVTVDRTVEGRWTTQVNEALEKPWGPDEVKRRVDLEGRFNQQRGLAYFLQELYTQAGWRVRVDASNLASDRFVALEFERPGATPYILPGAQK